MKRKMGEGVACFFNFSVACFDNAIYRPGALYGVEGDCGMVVMLGFKNKQNLW